jgi:hypothetical protein
VAVVAAARWDWKVLDFPTIYFVHLKIQTETGCQSFALGLWCALLSLRRVRFASQESSSALIHAEKFQGRM